MRIRFVSCCLLLFLSKLLFGQDPEFSQLLSNPLYLNPAFTGTSLSSRIAINCRNQWPQNGATFNTYSISYDSYIDWIDGGVGLQVFHDRENNTIVNYTSASAIYTHAIKIKKNFAINSALQVGLGYKQYNPENLVFPSMINQVNGNITGNMPNGLNYEAKLFPDFGIGILGQYIDRKYKHDRPEKIIYGGFCIQHLNRPDISLFEEGEKGEIPIKFTMHASADIYRWNNNSGNKMRYFLSPNVSYLQQGKFKQLNTGTFLTLKTDFFDERVNNRLNFGLWYRNNLSIRTDALIFQIGFVFEEFEVRYSYDQTISKLSRYSYGSHEISINILFGNYICISPNKMNYFPPLIQ